MFVICDNSFLFITTYHFSFFLAYLRQPAEPLEGVGLYRHRDTWLLVSASVCAVLLLLILIVIIILGLGKRKRKQRRIKGSANNRGQVFEREQQKKKHRRKGGDSTGAADNMAFQPDDDNDDKVFSLSLINIIFSFSSWHQQSHNFS